MRENWLALIIPLALLLPVRICNAQNENLTWLLSYRDQFENKLAWDSRFAPFLQRDLPANPLPSWDKMPVNQAALYFLRGVPGYIEVKGNRYFIATGCPAHACVARAMLWVDTQANTVVFIATGDEQDNRAEATRAQYHIASANLYLATNSPAIAADKLPDALREAIIRWLHLEGVLTLTDVTLLTPSGSAPVTTDELGWTGRFPLSGLESWNQ
jgi:hypothetical protein